MQKKIVKIISSKKPLFFVLSVVAVLLIVIGILTALALSDPNRDQGKAAPDSGTALTKLGVAAISGEPARLTADEMNSLLASKFPVQTPRLTVNADESVQIYAPVNYKGIHVGVTANVTIGCDPNRHIIYAAVHSLYLGRLPVDPSLGLKLAKGDSAQRITVDGSVLSTDSTLFDFGLLSEAAGMEISDIQVKDGDFVIGVSGDLTKLREFIVQAMPSVLENLK